MKYDEKYFTQVVSKEGWSLIGGEGGFYCLFSKLGHFPLLCQCGAIHSEVPFSPPPPSSASDFVSLLHSHRLILLFFTVWWTRDFLWVNRRCSTGGDGLNTRITQLTRVCLSLVNIVRWVCSVPACCPFVISHPHNQLHTRLNSLLWSKSHSSEQILNNRKYDQSHTHPNKFWTTGNQSIWQGGKNVTIQKWLAFWMQDCRDSKQQGQGRSRKETSQVRKQ